MNRRRILIKLGGSTLQDSETLRTMTEAITRLQNDDVEVVLVHGGGPSINQELVRRGITWSFENGQRVTSPEMMNVITEVLEDQVNASLVQHLQDAGLRAVPFSGRKNLLFCSPSSPSLGRIGEVRFFDAAAIVEIFKADPKSVPVITPLGCDDQGQSFNVNADFAASCIGQFTNADEVWFLTDQTGILDAELKPIHTIDREGLERLIAESVVTGGMLTKVRACLRSIDSKAKTVRILKAADVLKLLEDPTSTGTLCLGRIVSPSVLSEAIL